MLSLIRWTVAEASALKYLTEFRDEELAGRLIADIRRMASRRWILMEVCGGQTHSLLRHGIDAELREVIELIHGPGCPVCVTPPGLIDLAQEISRLPGTILTSFGDMLRVPGSRRSLLDVRAAGGNVQTVYSPLDAVKLAGERPNRQVVFFAVGFETTVPATALAIQQAMRFGLENFSLLVGHVRVLPAMKLLASADDFRVDGFLAAGHVCTVSGFEDYFAFSKRFCIPVAITGFEPVDLLWGIDQCVKLLEDGRHDVINTYQRVARTEGNLAAKRLVDEVFEVRDRSWRGFGNIPDGGLALRESFQYFCAEHRFGHLLEPFTSSGLPMLESTLCRGGEVLAGRIKPTQCQFFGSRCTPDTPLGAPMVSDEGACSAYHRYNASASC